MLNKFYLYFLGIILVTLPLFYSLDTQQIFSVNKFLLILFFVGMSGLYFGSSQIYTIANSSKNIKHTISLTSILFISALAVVLFISTYFSITPIISFFGSDTRHFGALFIVTLLLTFLFTSQIFTNNSTTANKIIVRFIFIPITIAGILTALWAISQYAGYPPIFGGVLNFDSLSTRSFAGMGQPNFCAQFLLFPFFITCYFLIKNFCTKNIYSVILHSNILVLYAFALYSTGSRAGILGVIAGLATVLIIYFSYYLYKKNITNQTTAILHSTFILNTGISFIIFGILSFCFIIFTFGESISLYLGERGDSIAARFYFWNDAIKLIKNFFWTGTGADMMNIPFAQSLSVQAFETENFHASPDRTHSIVFDVFLQYGVFGFVLFIFGIWKTIHTALSNIFASFIFNKIKKIDVISIISLASFIAILTAWIFGFAVITDSFITVIFIAIIFRNINLSIPNKQKQIIFTLNNKFIVTINSILIIFSLFVLYTAITINASEKALYSLTSQKNIPEKIKFQHIENIEKTPYFVNNLFMAYPYFSEKQKTTALNTGDFYNFNTNAYYQAKIFQSKNIENKYVFLDKLIKNAGNSFKKQLHVLNIANREKLISPQESYETMQYIAQNLVPSYYFNSKNQSEKKWKKFWKHNTKEGNLLRRYK